MPILEALLEDPTRAHPLHVLGKAVGRRKDSVKRSMPKLVHAGLVEELDPERYRLHPDFEANFLQELEDTGIVQSERLQREKHAREREAWRTLPDAPAAEPRPPREETETLYNASFHRDNAHVRQLKEREREREKRESSPAAFREALDSLVAPREERLKRAREKLEREACEKQERDKEADVILLDEYRAARGDVTPGRACEESLEGPPPASRDFDDGLGDVFDRGR